MSPLVPRDRLPRNWATLGWHQKAAMLCTLRIARDYSTACSLLASGPRRKARAVMMRLPYCDN